MKFILTLILLISFVKIEATSSTISSGSSISSEDNQGSIEYETTETCEPYAGTPADFCYGAVNFKINIDGNKETESKKWYDALKEDIIAELLTGNSTDPNVTKTQTTVENEVNVAFDTCNSTVKEAACSAGYKPITCNAPLECSLKTYRARSCLIGELGDLKPFKCSSTASTVAISLVTFFVFFMLFFY